MFRILYGDMENWELKSAERSIAGRLLHQFLKHRLPEALQDWPEFADHHNLYNVEECPDLTLQRVAEVIVPLTPNDAITKRVIVINFDEVANVLSVKHQPNNERKGLFTRVLHLLAKCSRTRPSCYFCVVLTSTEALQVLELPRYSGMPYKSIQLPLLTVKHMYEVVKHITQLCIDHVGETDPRAQSAIVQLVKKRSPQQLQTEPRLRYFTYLLELLAGVPRFLEKALFSIGSESQKGPFRPERFLDTLVKASDRYYLSSTLLAEVVTSIQKKYPRFKSMLDSMAIFPLLVTCSLFKAPVYRSQSICHGIVGAVGNRSYSIQVLEDSGVIFLVKAVSYCTKTLPPQSDCHHVHPLGPRSIFLRPWLTKPEDDDQQQFALVIPFIWMHLVAANDVRHHTLLPQVQLLSELGWSLTPSEKEHFSLSVLALRLYFLIECLRKNEMIMFNVSDLFPAQSHSVQPSNFRLPGVAPESCSWQITKSSVQLTVADFSRKTPRKTAALFVQNAPQAPSADSFVDLDPLIAIQDKQRHSSKVSGQCGERLSSSHCVDVDDIKLERAKCNSTEPHLFVFITDQPFTQRKLTDKEQKELENVVIVHKDNEEAFFGPFLTRSKLYHDQDENVPRADPTQSLDEVLHRLRRRDDGSPHDHCDSKRTKTS